MARPASERRSSGSSVRISRQLAVRLTSITSPQASAVMWPERRQRPEDAGIADEDVELAPALVDGGAQRVDLVVAP